MALAVTAVSAAPAAAQNFKFLSGNPYSNPTLKVGSYNYYVSPYRGQFLSVPGQPVVDIFCVDFSREVTNGQQWTAAFTTLDGSSMANTCGVRFRGGPILPRGAGGAPHRSSVSRIRHHQRRRGAAAAVARDPEDG
jgi:hypothetical protein